MENRGDGGTFGRISICEWKEKSVLIPDFNFHLDPDVFGGPITAEKFRKLNVHQKKPIQVK